jgi:hypothetical protein
MYPRGVKTRKHLATSLEVGAVLREIARQNRWRKDPTEFLLPPPVYATAFPIIVQGERIPKQVPLLLAGLTARRRGLYSGRHAKP